MPVDPAAAAEEIWAAAQAGRYYPEEWKGRLDPVTGYQAQLAGLDLRVKAGDAHAGWKVGLTSKAMQRQQGVHEPLFGYLLESGRMTAPAVLEHAALHRPGFENELCLLVGERLAGPGVTYEQAQAAIAAVCPAFEIVEVRGPFGEDVPLGLADNIQQRAFVTGAEVPPPAGRRLVDATVEILVNGEVVERAAGSDEIGDPVATLAWLANKLAEFGRPVEAGQRIMSGSFTKQYPLAPGQRIEARFDLVGSVRAEVR
ncbi:MAG: 2-keto-4-pentenoate hydratase [Acidimicrobiales bacterium]